MLRRIHFRTALFHRPRPLEKLFVHPFRQLSSDLIVPDGPPSPESIFGRKPPLQPETLPSIPLFTRPHFPKIIAPVVIQDPKAFKAFVSLRDTGLKHVGLFLHKSAHESDVGASYTDASQLHKVGVLAEIVRMAPRQRGLGLTMLCHHRIRWTKVVESEPLLKLETVPVAEMEMNSQDVKNQEVRAYSLAVIETMKELLQLGSFYKEQLELLLESVDVNNPYHLADLGACLTTADPLALQEVLEETSLVERLSKTLNLLKADLDTTRVQHKINKQIEDNISKSQRKYFLTEQLKSIKKELGMEKDEKEALLQKFRARLENKEVPESTQQVIDDEMEKLSSLEPSSSEYNVTRTYLDWLTELPWGVYSKDSLSIKNATKVLDEQHYGLADIKGRILEFIAVGKMKASVSGRILLLCGPPGVGKTSIGRSIADALNRKFYRFSVGGMGDVAEIKGHRRTYVGAMPGKLVQALKLTGVSNPVIMIDEIDKLGRHWAGDPAGALLEALDPEQNSAFRDHYLDVDVDLSKVLFIATGNVTDTIPKPLLDRMELLRLSGYILEEKVAIARRYLIPTARSEAGLVGKNVTISVSAVKVLARDYCREAGVRNLQKHVEKIFRKVALEIARSGSPEKEGEDKSEPVESPSWKGIHITSGNLERYVGKPVFPKERLYAKTPAGIATGLAWTSMGGATLYTESVRVEGSKPGLKTTGQLGDVMKESTEIAYSFAKNFIGRISPSNRFFDSAGVHMHIPEGATPKDGPSAGCVMVTSLLSLATGKPILPNLAMTGEITLTGKVLPVGGIKEKVIAAKRSGIKVLVLPESNRKDWDELAAYLKVGIEVHFCEEYEQVFQVAFPVKKEAYAAGGQFPVEDLAARAR